ncbi:hypothetical protein MTDSW087_05627 [Methylobacterium dankookense]|uniref:Uncharacterized protein n=1 Tax=Methylobacterium dankookense TaxID=560405 RepID=A0A564G5R8_9HYPH|nr:hypothetical protein IFDJLNFL_5662 [Methylobacterium dankookense]VUF15879.1 hypothetical protein MTDSW087_05627 [Methylobacterium dankookense]
MCPVMRKLTTLVVHMSQLPRLQERGQLIDQLTDLEAEGIARNVPRRTVEMIRAVRLQLRVEGLMPRTPPPRGH